MLRLDWIATDTTGALLELQRVNLRVVQTTGVYLIWQAGSPPRTIRLGQGDIADRLSEHKNNPLISAHGAVRPLYVSWATLPASALDGVECYLARRLSPVVGDRFPNCPEIAVDLPWAA